jgi:hypothetical protein
MLAALAAAGAVLRRPLPGAPEAGTADATAGQATGAPSGMVDRLGTMGEGVIALARASSGPVTALVAGVAACGAYAHAETGRPGSAAAAVAEAVAVVAFARIFGPGLGLRQPRRPRL